MVILQRIAGEKFTALYTENNGYAMPPAQLNKIIPLFFDIPKTKYYENNDYL